MKHLDFLSAGEVKRCTPYPELIAALDAAFRDQAVAPPRHHHTISQPGGADATLLLMPAWRSEGALGVKVVNVFPGNNQHGLPAVNGIYLVFDGKTGQLRAVLDGNELTARRTAAASALASRYVSSISAKQMLMIGTGRLARELIQAHCLVRPIERVLVWGRDPDKAQALITELHSTSVDLDVANDLNDAIGQADIISTATLSTCPLVRGSFLKSGAHVDLVGAYRPDMRESDDDVMRRARSIIVDTREGALAEGGDLVQPIESGVLDPAKIVADLAQLACGRSWTRGAEDITVFKSVGASLEDLAAAELCIAMAGQLEIQE